MRIWQFQEAKAKLTQLVNNAKHEPQVVSRHGIPEIVVLSLKKYESLLGQKDVVSFFRNSPLCGVDLDIERDTSSPREFDLG